MSIESDTSRYSWRIPAEPRASTTRVLQVRRPSSTNTASAVPVTDFVTEPISKTSACWIAAPLSMSRTPATAIVGGSWLLAIAAAIPGTAVSVRTASTIACKSRLVVFAPRGVPDPDEQAMAISPRLAHRCSAHRSHRRVQRSTARLRRGARELKRSPFTAANAPSWNLQRAARWNAMSTARIYEVVSMRGGRRDAQGARYRWAAMPPYLAAGRLAVASRDQSGPSAPPASSAVPR